MRAGCDILVLLSQKIQINLLTVNNLPDLLNIHDLNASPVAGVGLIIIPLEAPSRGLPQHLHPAIF
ncbi:hypothetical protein EAJ79_21420 [Salmonella enterica]|nr:hypothetical protein [Salmonella enterica]